MKMYIVYVYLYILGKWSGRPVFNPRSSYQRLKKWYLMLTCLTLSIIR